MTIVLINHHLVYFCISNSSRFFTTQVLFFGTDQGAAGFPNLLEGVWTLWICVTTANYPDVMMPSYNNNRLSALFFVTFMIVSFFYLMNLVLAAVVNAYVPVLGAEELPVTV